MKKALLLVTVFLLGLAAVAQEFPRAEVAAMYSYARFRPAPSYTSGLNLNGGGGQVTFNFNRYFGMKAELAGYANSKATFNDPEGSVSLTGNTFTYLFGPQIKVRTEKLHPYFHALFGGARVGLGVRCVNLCEPGAGEGSENAFAMALGGGLDIPVSHLIAIRVGQFDYLMTRFSNLESANQHNFRYSAGIVFNFGNH